MKRMGGTMVWLLAIVLYMQTQPFSKVIAAANNGQHKARPKIDLSDPFYNGQIQYDDSLTETPIGTIVYAMDDVSVDSAPSDSIRSINYQLQDVVTHGNFNDRNLFTIGDGNDANIDIDSEEDDDDVIDVDGVVDKQPNKQSKFANFAFNADKSVSRRNLTHGTHTPETKPNPIIDHMIQRQNQSDALNTKQLNNENREPYQGQKQFEDNMMATRSPNRQMTYKHTNKTTSVRSKSHRHRNNHKLKHSPKWYRRHNKWIKHGKHHRYSNDRYHGNSRSGLNINPIVQSNMRPQPSYVEAHVNYFDPNVDDSWKSNRFGSATTYRSDKWPHLTRLQSQLHQDMLGDSLPPYIKKYNRRNKQLIGLLEGQGMPNVDTDLNHRGRPVPPPTPVEQHTDHERWIETNLFEAQLSDANSTKPVTHTDFADPSIPLNGNQRFLDEKNVQNEPNGIPGEHLSLSAEDQRKCDEDDLCVTAAKSPRPADTLPLAYQRSHRNGTAWEKLANAGIISPRADSFLFHRVATPKLVGTGALAGSHIKQKLPFVALTDKRLEDGTRQRRTNIVQNRFPIP